MNLEKFLIDRTNYTYFRNWQRLRRNGVLTHSFDDPGTPTRPWLEAIASCNPGRHTPPELIRVPIPDDDLKVLEKIYHRLYPSIGRKRGTLLRYIKEGKEHEPEEFIPMRLLISKLERKASELISPF